MEHTDLELRHSPSSWIYSELIDKAFKDKEKILCLTHAGTLAGMTEVELFKHVQDLSPYCVWEHHEGKTERQILSNIEHDTVIDIDCYRKGRDAVKCSIRIATTNKNIYEEIVKLVKKHLIKDQGNTVHCIGQSSSGLTLQELGTIDDQLIQNNYDHKTIEKTQHVIEQINSTNPQGRLVIINGQPGTGKTHLIKGIIPQIRHSLIILLPTRLISEVDGPALVSLLAEWKTDYSWEHHGKHNVNPAIVLVLEDADDCLTTRNDSNMSVVSSILNHTDGIFGSMLDLRLIATTNAHQLEFDKAFTRPGRLCAHITIDKLEAEHATKIYERITGGKKKKYTKPITLAEVYANANNNPYGHIEKDKKLGFTK